MIKTRIFHGTGNLPGFIGDDNKLNFDPKLTGHGADQLGSGFYLTDQESTASGYACDSNWKYRTADGERLGGNDHAGIVIVDVAMKNPIVINAQEDIFDAHPKISEEQVVEIIRRAPRIYDIDHSPLRDEFDIEFDGGVHDWHILAVAERYTNLPLYAIENDYFNNYGEESQAFREACRDILGIDGIVQNFESGETHYIAWFPEQITPHFENTLFLDLAKEESSEFESDLGDLYFKSADGSIDVWIHADEPYDSPMEAFLLNEDFQTEILHQIGEKGTELSL